MSLRYPGKLVKTLSYSTYSAVPTVPLEPNLVIVVTVGFDRDSNMTWDQRVEWFADHHLRVVVYPYFDTYYGSHDLPLAPRPFDVDVIAQALHAGAIGFEAESKANYAARGRLYWVGRNLWSTRMLRQVSFSTTTILTHSAPPQRR